MTFAAPLLAGIVAAIAVPALIILYFLKLRRIPREVSSTLLWKKTIQDLQANAPFQRLRKNLLLFLQLIILGLILLALAQPRSATTSEQGKKYLIMIDRSASMAAVDGDASLGAKSRLERAKEDAIALVETMREPSVFDSANSKADEAMIIAFDASAEIIAPFTSDHDTLIKAINAIQQTDAPSSIEEAYRLAQAQRPNRLVQDRNEAGEVTSTVELDELKGGDPYFFHLYSDGRITDLDSVRADQLENDQGRYAFEYHAVGAPTSNNIGLVALRSERDYDDPTKLSIFVGVQSTDTIERSVDAEFIIDGVTRSVRQIDLPAAKIDDTTAIKTPASGGVVFELVEPNAVLARVRLDTNGDENPEADVLLTDNEGALIVPPAKQAAVALVSSGNLFVQSAISGFPLSKFEIMSPSEYEAKRDRGDMAVFDVVVLDSYLPRANEQGVRLEPGRYLILGKVLTGPMGVTDNGVGPGGAIIDWRRTHPVLRDLTLDALLMAETPKIEIPKGSGVVSLAETAQGPAIFETSDTDVRAIVVPFDIARTNWPFDVSFVVFLASAVDYLGTGSVVAVDESTRLIQPGSVLADRLPSDATGVRVQLPDGSRSPEIIPSADGRIVYGPIEQTGLYTLRWQGTPGPNDIVRENDVQRVFAANLLNPAESDVSTASTISLANTVVSTESSTQRKRIMDWWPWLLMGALAILMFEWWVYNKKMYL